MEPKKVKERSGRLESVFVIPPIGVLDPKSGRWKKRKELWIKDYGKNKEVGFPIKSELGRKDNLILDQKKITNPKSAYVGEQQLLNRIGLTGTSIFDPVLCECMYRWFTKKDDKILDPFAGGSVRGIVASKLNQNYTGIDLSKNQIDHNKIQGKDICKAYMPTWICDNGLNVDKLDEKFDFLFSCPPYYNLEKYSDNKEDISNMNYADFLKDYRKIIKRSCDKLKDNSFAVFVVGEVREKGNYVGFVPDTIQAFEDAGLHYYNEMILLMEPVGAGMRAEKTMNASRKVPKTHQNVLMFVKGSPEKAAEDLGSFKDNFEEIEEFVEWKNNEENVLPI